MKHRILVVDDEPRAVQLLVRILRPLGEVLTASSADEAWKIVQDNPVDLVISDQRMPERPGVELLRRVAELDDSIGRILMTGFTELESIIDAINLGQIHAYLKKPCDPDEVRDRATKVLNRVEHVRSRERLIRQMQALRDSEEGPGGSDA